MAHRYHEETSLVVWLAASSNHCAGQGCQGLQSGFGFDTESHLAARSPNAIRYQIMTRSSASKRSATEPRLVPLAQGCRDWKAAGLVLIQVSRRQDKTSQEEMSTEGTSAELADAAQ